MRERKERKLVAIEEVYFISDLPDALLGAIVSCLPGMECVRTSILSQRWKTVWNYSSQLNFDQRKMMKKSIEFYLQFSDPNTRLEMAICRKYKEYTQSIMDEIVMDEISKAGVLITSIIDGHIGLLKSCSIRHLPESSARGEILRWMMKLLEKRVRKVSLELEFPNHLSPHKQINPVLEKRGRTLNIPFEVFSSFENLELKNYRLVTSPSSDFPQVLKTLTLNNVVIISTFFQGILSHCSSLENLTIEQCRSITMQLKIESSSLKFFKISKMVVHTILVFAINLEVMEVDSIYCHHKSLDFGIPKLQVLHFYNDVQWSQQLYLHGTEYLTINDIFGGILSPQSSSMDTIFENMVTLCIDFDLMNIGNIETLLVALKSCHHLKNLQINNQVSDKYLLKNTYEDGCVSNRINLFWQTIELSECVDHQLKSLCIKEYTGKEVEKEFVKYIITNAGEIERITLWFVDECSYAEAVETLCLLAFPKASSKLSIFLKPGINYMKEVGGSIEKWALTLRN